MIQTTVQALRRNDVDTTGHIIYVVRNDTDILYVGQSVNICSRMRQHTSTTSYLGRAIYDNRPQSHLWQVDLYTIEECMEHIQRHFPYAPNKDQWGGRTMPMENFAEDALILDLTPRYNLITNHSHWEIRGRERHPEVQAWQETKWKEKEEAAARQKAQYEAKKALLINSVCTICGEHDQWVNSSTREPCGVLECKNIQLPGGGILDIPLVCHDCSNIINMMNDLIEKSDQVRKVEAAIAAHLAKKQ